MRAKKSGASKIKEKMFQGGPKILFLDIETAPHKVYTWGLYDQNISIHDIVEPGYTMCWAAKWAGQKKVEFARVQFTKTGKRNNTQMVRRIHEMMDEADWIVHYNGDRFDIPTLNQEFLQARMHPPSPSKQRDLLKTTRRRFRLPSNKLDYLARHLGLRPKVKNRGMELWRGCMENDPTCWREMEIYNRRDVTLLEEVFEELRPWISGLNFNLYVNPTKPICTACGGANIHSKGFERTATQIYQRFKCQDCGEPLRGRNTLLKKGDKENLLISAA